MIPDEVLIEWLRERLENCERFAAARTGNDREGWLEDAEYFRAAIERVSGGSGEVATQ